MEVKIERKVDSDNSTKYITKYRYDSSKKKKKVHSDTYLDALISHRDEVDYMISKIKARNARIAEEEAEQDE